MTKDEIQKVRDALFLANISACNTDEHVRTYLESIAILDAELAKPEQEPFCYVNVNAQGDVTRTIKREDKWCKTPLYRHPAPQSAQPVAVYEGENAMGFEIVTPLAQIPTGAHLYTAPQSREWQELSPLEMRDTLRNCAASTFDKLAPNWYEVRQFARAIESALRAKNHKE